MTRRRKDSGTGFVVLFSPPCRCELCRTHVDEEYAALEELLRDERDHEAHRDPWDGTTIGWRGIR